MPRKSPQDQLALLYAKFDKLSATSLDEYLRYVVIDSRPEPKPFGDVIEPWQVERNKWVVPGFEYVAGVRDQRPAIMSNWLGFAKGQDKSSYIGRCLMWATRYGRRPLRMYCCARDADQAAVIYDAMQREASLNPWASKELVFKRNIVINEKNDARTIFLTSDSSGAHGKTPDVLVCDEITHWENDSLWQAMYSATEKRGGSCMTLILTNAGYLGSWQDRLRQLAKSEHGKTWFVHEQPVGVIYASWMKGGAQSEARKFLSDTEARRLLDNEWIDPAEEGTRFLSPGDIDKCIGEPLPPPPGARVVLGIDYGGTVDPTALAACWWDGHRVHVFELKCLQGSKDNEVQTSDVKAWVEAKFNKYKRVTAVYDRYQLLEQIQFFERAGRDVRRFEYRAGKGNFAMAQTMKNLIQNGKIVFSETAGLRGGETLATELKRLIVKDMAYGYRFDHKANGHDDRCVAVGQAVMEAIGGPPPPPPGRPPKPHDPELAFQRPTTPRPFNNAPLFRSGLYGIR